MPGINIIIKEVKKKASKYYAAKKQILREDARNRYRSLSEKPHEYWFK